MTKISIPDKQKSNKLKHNTLFIHQEIRVKPRTEDDHVVRNWYNILQSTL